MKTPAKSRPAQRPQTDDTPTRMAASARTNQDSSRTCPGTGHVYLGRKRQIKGEREKERRTGKEKERDEENEELGSQRMSVNLQFDCPAEGGMVQKNSSFIGFNTLTSRHRLSSASLHTKVLPGTSTKIQTFTQVVGGIWGQQPEQVDRVFQALPKGLKEHLEVQKTKLEFLSTQQRNTMRNSRLAFFYDLDKEIRAMERYIRRLEFQISKVEGLYETYCIQWRLCEGAVNMKQAFSLSPSSRESRASQLELNRNHRHSLEDMCLLERELEILLGELQIKMKGLIGFARLCPGDQYEVLIRLGRQRWKIKGRIQSDDQQLWDEEQMVFLPHIHDSFEIKVTEVRSLSSILVGMVTCKCADFYSAHPQMMIVDITELGTIKLQLEVVWNPFDSGIMKNLSSSASRQSSSIRKRPSMMHQFQDADGSFSVGSHEFRGVSLLNYLSESGQAVSPVYDRASRPPIVPDISTDNQLVNDDHLKTPLGKDDESGELPSKDQTGSPHPGNSKRDTITLFPCYSTPDILQQNCVVVINQEAKPVKSNVIVEKIEEEVKENSQRRAVSIRVRQMHSHITTTLQEMSYIKGLKNLNLEIQHLTQVLKRDIYILKTSSSEALNVEEDEVLGSFDFLSFDFNTEDTNSCMSGSRLKDTSFKVNTGISKKEMSEDTALLSQQQQTGKIIKTESEDRSPLSTGEYTLDQALEIHLNICIVLLRALRASNLKYMRQYILEAISHQTDVLKKITIFAQRKTCDISETELWFGVPKLRNVMMMWNECCESAPAFCCTADSFHKLIRKWFIHKVKAKLPGQADTVFAQLLQQIQSSSMVIPLATCTTDQVTLFQLCVYLNCWKVTNFGEHIAQMSREVYLVSCLQTPKRRRVLKKLKGRRIAELQPMGQTLFLLAKLLTDNSQKVAISAASCLSKASKYKSFRLKALAHYTWLLKDNDIQVQQQACLALKYLKALESAEQVAELWHSTDEELRNAAKETIISFGKNAQKAFQRIDQICTELQEEIYKNLKTEITIF